MKDDVKQDGLGATALRNIAAEAAGAFNSGAREVQPFSGRHPSLTMDDAYRITALANGMRVANGYRPVGRKIGFTNRRLWDEYGVRAPIWGYVYDRTLHDLATPLPLAPYSAPKIEPEIMFGLAKAPAPGMDDTALLDCVDWVAHASSAARARTELRDQSANAAAQQSVTDQRPTGRPMRSAIGSTAMQTL